MTEIPWSNVVVLLGLFALLGIIACAMAWSDGKDI